MRYSYVGNLAVGNLKRLLQDPRVRTTVNVQNMWGDTALHCACTSTTDEAAANKARLLLQAGADPLVTSNNGEKPLDVVRKYHSAHYATIALLEQNPAAHKDAEKASLVIMARLAAAANSNTVAPSCLQGRMDRGQPLPRVALVPLTDGQNDGEEEGEEGRKLRTTLAFMCGLGREGMPKELFHEVMDLLQPTWDPLKRKITGTGPPAAQG